LEVKKKKVKTPEIQIGAGKKILTKACSRSLEKDKTFKQLNSTVFKHHTPQMLGFMKI
jgi:hypothetical protein